MPQTPINVVQGMFSGIYYYAFDMDSHAGSGLPLNPVIAKARRVKDFIDQIVSARSEDSIVSLVFYPYEYSGMQDQASSDPVEPVYEVNPVSFSHTFARPSRVGSYTPRNKKLLSFPYNFFTVSTLSDSKELRYEWFNYASEENPVFTVKTVGSLSATPEIACVPVNYKSVTGDNWGEEIVLAGFPQLAFTIDTYRAWTAQHGEKAILSGIASGVSIAATVASGGLMAPAAITTTMGFANTLVDIAHNTNKADAVRGNASGSVECANNVKTFYFKNSHITEEYARMLDDYFDKFGYACCRVQRPNIHARSRWTFVKTRESAIAGRIPSDDLQKIQQIFDTGITFWADLIHTGDYSFAANEELS